MAAAGVACARWSPDPERRRLSAERPLAPDSSARPGPARWKRAAPRDALVPAGGFATGGFDAEAVAAGPAVTGATGTVTVGIGVSPAAGVASAWSAPLTRSAILFGLSGAAITGGSLVVFTAKSGVGPRQK